MEKGNSLPLRKKAKEIAEGYSGLLKSKLGLSSENDEEVFAARKSICNSCLLKTKMNTCGKCGCLLSAKIRSLTSNCPDSLW